MATFTRTYIARTVGEIWQNVISEWSLYHRAGGSAFSLTLGTASGYRSVLQVSTYGGNTYNYTYVATDIAAAEVASLRQIAGSPGWRSRPIYQAALTGSSSASIASWRGVILPFRRAVWSTWAGATLGTTQTGNVTCEAGQMAAFFDYFVASKLYEVEVDTLLIYGWTTGSTVILLSDTGPSDGLDVGASVPGLNVSRIVEALDTMNNATQEISINHGAAIFSVKGGSVIG